MNEGRRRQNNSGDEKFRSTAIKESTRKENADELSTVFTFTIKKKKSV
jgi:hypothetical protein